MSNLLIVDDEESICWGLAKLVRSLGHTPITKPSAEAALQLPQEEHPAAIVLDVRLPGMSGLEAMAQLRIRFGSVPIIVITAYGDLATAVESVRNGAFEYVVKPFETDEIRELISRALQVSAEHKLQDQQQVMTSSSDRRPTIDGMTGTSRKMQEVFSHIALAAGSQAGVLIQGESGTGKELAARAIHRYSSRAEGPFIPVNIAALSSSLAESELFGHVRGAFTGAESDRAGLLKQAHGGTLFIDEVGDIPLEMQVKLLRALEHGVFTPVGGNQSIESDFRVVSATNANLERLIQQGDFRHDLYYRLSALRIVLPPLRERGTDILLLAQQFASCLGPRRSIITSEAAEVIRRRSWFGNVRELRNAIEHALVFARGGPIEARHLPEPMIMGSSEATPNDDTTLVSTSIKTWIGERLAAGDDAGDVNAILNRMIERPLIEGTLKRHAGNYSAASKDLGIHRTTLRKKVLEYEEQDREANAKSK